MNFNTPYVFYLENHDIHDNGSHYVIRSNIPRPNGEMYFSGRTIVMIQGNFCGFCTRMKPVFQQIAQDFHPVMDFATIQTDNDRPNESMFTQREFYPKLIGKELQGVPFIGKFEGGVFVDEYSGPREYDEIRKWILL